MLPRKEDLTPIGIEEVFHSLLTRIFAFEKGALLESEVEFNPKPALSEIDKYKWGFRYAQSLSFLAEELTE